MPPSLVTVEQAAEHLHLHPKTVLRYIRDGRLSATRVGKSYRIARARLDAFAGAANDSPEAAASVRVTCIVDVPDITEEVAERLATFLQAAAMNRPGDKSPLHLQTAFDPLAKSMKVVVVAGPSSVADLLEMLRVQMDNRV
ncbi:MAG: helix-turn-helix domain-containing protein [Burkholderiaceae bacterium]|nr:helix-turn-helix domain-containing protein [Burkholderiaceae bacterium]